ncbi:aldo/keto reductase [Coprobacter tertius]|uniref:Aldo/keto reductase n=1 Tax=Coprobacter tertius TaxID=2944915 RepID=A0ABT1MHS8_9BACT|nr:aldo/keto reductase [Coprobacter tertius]MCP9612193.1 aldo/keto reductase [Coprobacter tertius]
MKKIVTFVDDTQVCALGQGTWNMGDYPPRRIDEIRVLQAGIEMGMTAIDTAEMYGNGRSEQLVGEAIAGRRDKVFLITKILPSNATREGTKIACERSLKRLATDYIDLYLLHWAGVHPFEETVSGMLDLQKQGKIRQWGVSNMDVEDMENFFSIKEGNSCAADEVLYNLTRRGIEYDLIPWAQKHDFPLIAYSPVEQGRLLNHPVLREIAESHTATPVQIALAWVLRNPGIMAIPKASSLKHVEENYKSLSINLTSDDMKRLDEAFPYPDHKIPLEVI